MWLYGYYAIKLKFNKTVKSYVTDLIFQCWTQIKNKFLIIKGNFTKFTFGKLKNNRINFYSAVAYNQIKRKGLLFSVYPSLKGFDFNCMVLIAEIEPH